MNPRSHLQHAVRWSAATLAAALATALLVSSGVNSTTAGLVFLTLVVLFAAWAGIWLALYVALLCAVSFDYYFLPPVRTFQLVGVQAWLAMISFMLSCAVVGRVAERARGQARQAEHRREDVERLYTLSQEMMLQEDAAGLIRDLPRIIERIFALDGVVLYICDRDQLYSSTSELPMSIQASLRAMTESHNPAQTVPGGFMAMTLMLGLRPVGALALRPSVLSHEVATAVSAQVAIALTRAMAIEASTRMEASQEGERLRTALIDSLTHELRTPLTSIRAAATTLIDSDGLDDASRLDLATIVDEEASRLDRLIGEAVEMAEIDAQVVKVSPVAQRPRTLLDQAVAESQAALARHRVIINAEEPDKPAWFDAHLLGRVFRHLIENAARYSPPGSRITLRSRRAGGRLEFCVEDNGPGIGPVDLPLIFEKFYRGREGTASRKGTGMGLAIVRALLIAHGGAIEAASTRKEGTSFRFWVPLVEENPASELAALQTGNIQVLEKQS
ncbi:MAG TPA: ATP-binding protein [Terracidiphilus sp.]|nr:ATP-binding protein [Terracidiphilus sp.]